MEQLLPIIVQIIGGAVGGNGVAALLKNVNISKVVATIAGILGGVGGGQLAGYLEIIEKIFGAGAAGDIAGNGGAAAIGGALLTAIIGFIKKSTNPAA